MYVTHSVSVEHCHGYSPSALEVIHSVGNWLTTCRRLVCDRQLTIPRYDEISGPVLSKSTNNINCKQM